MYRATFYYSFVENGLINVFFLTHTPVDIKRGPFIFVLIAPLLQSIVLIVIVNDYVNLVINMKMWLH